MSSQYSHYQQSNGYYRNPHPTTNLGYEYLQEGNSQPQLPKIPLYNSDYQSLRTSATPENANLRNQFMQNANPSTDQVRYNRIHNNPVMGNDDDKDDDFNFGASKSVNAYEMESLKGSEAELPPTPPPHSPQKEQHNPFTDYNEFSNTQSFPYNYNPNGEFENPFNDSHVAYIPDKAQPPVPLYDEHAKMKHNEKERIRQLRSKPRFHFTRLPYFGILITTIQVIVFIVELVKMSQLTGSAFQTQPYFNPMLGPSTYVLINMGARYIPCMNAVAGITTDTSINYPCPNSTTTDTSVCSLNELCGLSGVPIVHNEYQPDQWYRIITPIFIHAGFLHIIFNLLLQISMGFSVERSIGFIKYAIIYLLSGISGFLLGANFTPNGIASSGASGSLFGIVATNIVMFIYCGTKNTNMYGTKRYGLFLAIMISEIVISFVLGLLPGLDNFSHIGGFAIGLLTSILLLKDPFFVYEDGIITYQSHLSIWQQFINNWNPMYNFADKIPSRFYIWCGVRVLALVLIIVYFALLIKNFFGKLELPAKNSCSWCKYISCLPVHGWCDQGTLEVNSTNGDSASASETSSAVAAASSEPSSIDNSNYKGSRKRSYPETFDTFRLPSLDSYALPAPDIQGSALGFPFFIVMGIITIRYLKSRRKE